VLDLQISSNCGTYTNPFENVAGEWHVFHTCGNPKIVKAFVSGMTVAGYIRLLMAFDG
jgi:hypothetical protein